MKRKLFAALLALVMVVSILPLGVFAAETVTTEAALVAAVANDNTIVLGADIALTERLVIKKNITLDLNGYTLSAEGETVYVGTAGVLVIDDTVGGGKIVSANDCAIGNYGLVTINAGTFVAGVDEEYDMAALYNYYWDDTTFGTSVINGGTFDNVFNCGDLTINDASIDWLDNSSDLEINGGTYGLFITADDADVAISGGTFNQDVSEYVEGGKIAVKVGDTWYVASDAPIQVTFDAGRGKVVGSATKALKFGDKYGELPTATLAGYDFIAWKTEDGEYVNADTTFMSEVSITLYAEYDANELQNTMVMPRTFPLTLNWNEGGSITAKGSCGNKNLIIAFGAKRTLDIVPEEGYEIVNVNVNGFNLGPINQYTVACAHKAYYITATFAPKLVEVFTPVYTENFDNGEGGWAKGGHMDSAVAENGVLKAVSTGGDPNINHGEVFGLSCDAIDAIRVKFTNNTADNRFQIFFTNEANPGYSEAGSFKATIEPNAENEVVIYTAGNDLWTGTLQNMRIDLANGAGDFVVESISFETVTMELAK